MGFVQGCLLVRTTEHIIKINDDRSGEGVIHLIDIRSDARSDSLVRRDFDDLMHLLSAKKVEEFERYGRTISSKRLQVRGDTLMGEVTYIFSSLNGIDGLRLTRDGMSLVFSPEREIIRTNGKLSHNERNETVISWDLDAKRLVYVVREKLFPASASLVPLWLKYAKR
jgi:hypothetical protein